MSYIGRDVDNISNVEKLDNITFDGGTTYALEKSSVAYTPSGANNILISVDGVMQYGNFTVSGTNIVFTGWSPTSSNTCDFILHIGVGLISTPADSSITNAKLTSSVISSQSLVTADSSNDHVLIHDATDSALKKALYPSGFDVSSITGATALATQPASDDEIVLSDAGTLKRLDIKHIQNTPSFMASISGDQTLTNNTWTKLAFDTEVYDSDSAYDNSTNYRFTPAVAGKYFVFSTIFGDSNADYYLRSMATTFYKNGAAVYYTFMWTEATRYLSDTLTAIIDLDADDYIECYGRLVENTSATLKIESGDTNCTFGAFRIAGV